MSPTNQMERMVYPCQCPLAAHKIQWCGHAISVRLNLIYLPQVFWCGKRTMSATQSMLVCDLAKKTLSWHRPGKCDDISASLMTLAVVWTVLLYTYLQASSLIQFDGVYGYCWCILGKQFYVLCEPRWHWIGLFVGAQASGNLILIRPCDCPDV